MFRAPAHAYTLGLMRFRAARRAGACSVAGDLRRTARAGPHADRLPLRAALRPGHFRLRAKRRRRLRQVGAVPCQRHACARDLVAA